MAFRPHVSLGQVTQAGAGDTTPTRLFTEAVRP